MKIISSCFVERLHTVHQVKHVLDYFIFFFQYLHVCEISRMTEDGTGSSLSVGQLDSLATPPMFKSAAGWRTESKHLPEAFRPEPFLLAAISSLLLQVCLVLMRPLSAGFAVDFQTILRPFRCSLPPPNDVMTKKHKLTVDLMSSKVLVENCCPVCVQPKCQIWLYS